MSASSAWAYTSKFTHWALTGFDDWTGAKAYSAPTVYACDYSAKSERMTDDNGTEFTSRQTIFTEFAGAKQGDMVLIGVHTGDPIAAKAFEVRSVARSADTFDGVADDYKVTT
jgi:hypothetical protein